MRREIPNHVAVMLKQAQVHPRRIVVVEIAECPIREQLLYFADCAGEQERVVHHDLEVLPLRQVDQFLGLRPVARERLLHEYMLAVFERGLGQFIVRPHRGDHRDGIHAGRFYQFAGVAIDRDSGMRRRYALAGCGSLIAYSDDLATFQGAQIAHDIRTPIAVPDDTKSKHRIHLIKTVCVVRRSSVLGSQ